ncbi:MAG TPA: hypothetical protein VFZ65_08110 [Planctomycetota bacterium]|nr:hypothetical protein [Planctomycetota bacterium]
MAASLALCSASATLRAQEGDGLPTEYVVQVPPNGLIDLDSGLVLPQPAYRGFRADLRFGRDGAGFYLEPLFGGSRAAPGDTAPPATLAPERVRIGRSDAGSLIVFARTDRGMARVELMVADPYSTASASLRWVVVPPKGAVFLPAPSDLEATWVDGKLQVAWHGDEPRWLVEVITGDEVRKVTCGEPRVAIEGLDAKGHHRLRVRGLTANNEVTMPAEVVQWGPRQVPQHGLVEFPDRWYNASGGLRLSSGERADADAEVVFYLYGVHVPGGGVRKVGVGERVFTELCVLPAGPLPPVYGRLDDNDVLVVQLADGRYGKLWLEPARGDLRDGMRVHFVFLPDGRRTLLAPPQQITSERTPAGPRLSWAPDPAAVSYRVAGPGLPAALDCTEPNVVLATLAAEHVHELEVVAVAADGERSLPAHALVSTHTAPVRIGRGSVQAQNGGFVFATGAAAARGAACDLALVGGAGGAAVLHFAATGIAAAGAFAFGEFPPGDTLTFRTDWHSDSGTPGADTFYVQTADGGLASVRIIKRAWPEPEFEYVWRPRQ